MNGPYGDDRSGITGDWVRRVDLPVARRVLRGYDRRAVDEFLLLCATEVDRLTARLHQAEDEIGRLTDEVTARSIRFDRMVSSGRGRRGRHAPTSPRTKRSHRVSRSTTPS